MYNLTKVNEKYGLERGCSIRETGAKHRTNEEYWKWLTENCNQLEQEKSGKEKSIRLLDDEISKNEKKVKSFKTMISNLSDTILILEGEIGEKEMDLDERNADYQNKMEEINELKDELAEAKAKLEQRQQQLRETNENLLKLKSEQEQIKQKIEDSKEELNSIQSMTINAIATLAESKCWKTAGKELKENNFFSKEYRDNLSAEGKGWFDKFYNECIDGTFIEEIAKRSNEVISCASAIFLGYLNEATQIASSGGGGGVQGALNGWGRKKDEDEWAYLGRCCAQARSMCRPASRGRRR